MNKWNELLQKGGGKKPEKYHLSLSLNLAEDLQTIFKKRDSEVTHSLVQVSERCRVFCCCVFFSFLHYAFSFYDTSPT